jgi:manganese oxidase
VHSQSSFDAEVGMRALPAVVALTLLLGPASTFPPDRSDPVRVNDNRTPAGVLRDGELSVRLDARRVDWRPDGEDRPGVDVFAFGEEGGAASIPGPLIRVPEGTRIRVSVRNAIPGATLTVVGFGGAADTLRIPQGEVRETSFIAGPPGTYFYFGSTASLAGPPGALDSQLSGAFIVDPVDAGEPRDRIFVLGLWTTRPNDLPTDTSLLRFVINGRPWPHTERLVYDEGDSIRWRVINTSAAVHPMHLHGFYYRVDSRGDGRVDNVYPAGGSPRHAVTERLAPYTTMSMTWAPDRPGNWLFHCHDNVHILPIHRQLDGSPPRPADGAGDHANHALTSMGGLVLGAYVRPRSTQMSSEPVDRRRFRLMARVDSGSTEAEPAYAFALEEPGRGAVTGPSLPGPPIVLRRGEPVGITVVNELQEPTAVHWHGIELDSYYDGVAGFAGTPGHIAPAIAPADSFEARFTPPRAGTFIYHTHVDETRQQRAGLSGALIVLEPGETWDPATDITVLLTTPRRAAEQNRILLNGSLEPAPLELEAGRRHRIRIINIHTYRPSMRVTVRQDTTLVQWRSLAKDGADLPPDRRTMGPAALQPGNGETFDFELIPQAAGELRLDVVTGVGIPLAHMLLRVR